MTAAQHIQAEQALFLVALDDTDPDKLSALAHAANCKACQRLIRESQAMLQLLDREPAKVEIDAALEARIHTAVLGSAPQTQSAQTKRPWEYLAWLAGVLASGLLVWLDAQPNSAYYADVGMRCMRFELGLAMVALGAGVIWTRRAGTEFSPLRASVVAMSGALIGQLLLRVRCEAHDAALHLLLFHLLGVVMAMVLGGVAGKVLHRPA